jgi:alkaline phosphatase D
MPVREQEEDIIRRSVDFGDLLRVYFLDTRIEGRDEQVGIGSDEVNSSDRTLLGQEQKDWLSSKMEESPAKWNVLAQQVMMAPLEAFGLEINTDQWDGYQADRNWLYNTVQGIGLSNFVVLTGDIHTAWANNLPLGNYNENTEVGSVGVEFVCTSVTSEALPIDLGEGLVQFLNPHVEYVDLNEHGYMILDLNENRAQADWYYVNDLEISQYGEYLGASYLVYCDEHFLDPADFPATGGINDAPFAPLDPFNGDVQVSELPGFSIVSAYPNPAQTELTVQWANFRDASVKISLVDLNGSIVSAQAFEQAPAGLHYITLPMSSLAAGMYLLRMQSEDEVATLKVLKH